VPSIQNLLCVDICIWYLKKNVLTQIPSVEQISQSSFIDVFSSKKDLQLLIYAQKKTKYNFFSLLEKAAVNPSRKKTDFKNIVIKTHQIFMTIVYSIFLTKLNHRKIIIHTKTI